MVKGEKHHNWKGGEFNHRGYIFVYVPLHPRNSKGYVAKHILIVESVLGKFLPKKTVIHHHNQNPSENKKPNLVVCENQSFHRLIHTRMDAFKNAGNPNARRCCYCRTWSMGLDENHGHIFHRDCHKIYCREYRLKKKSERKSL